MESSLHEAASHHLPVFITPPGDTDWLFVLMAIVLIGAVLGIGVFFFWLHSLPERMVHNKVQFDIVAVLALISLFTHIHAFWVAALIIALIEFPDFSWPDFSNSMKRIAGSLEVMAGTQANSGGEKSLQPGASAIAPTGAPPTPLHSNAARADGQSSATQGHEQARKREAGHA